MNDSTLQALSIEDGGFHGDHEISNRKASSWVVGIVFLLLLGMIGLFIADRLYHPAKFRIEQIEVRGQLEHVNGDQVSRVVRESLKGNYFSASLAQLEAEIEQIPWVYSATVRRQWPSTLVVRVDEVQPIAKWGDHLWLNASGDLVKRQPWDQPLPILRGPLSKQEEVWHAFQRWHGKFAAHGLSLDSLELDERELWYLTLSLSALAVERYSETIPSEISSDKLEPASAVTAAQVTMIVDNSDAEGRISRLIEALNSQLLAEFPGMKSIDLRYPNGFAIDWINQSPESQKLTDSE